MEEETISMTMEEDNNQYNPIEIKDNRIYNNYIMSIENEEDDDKEFNKKKTMKMKKNKRNRGKSGGGYERKRRNEKRNTSERPNHQ
ncbi:hypothetical protein ENUP19_0305G0023 [Entamoeba nuttalli]|uniref:Uncharacterized protein n=1 Tax=Entamoeba nuttalli TaxID=412467 RepID=A0ABQ0DV96_9EUKA